MKRRSRVLVMMGVALLGVGQLALAPSPPATAAPAGTEHRPDLQTLIPSDSFSVVTTATGREFRYTHLIYNNGPGPLEIQPSYDQASGGYRGMQQLFTHNAAGVWSMVRQVRVPDTFTFHAEHGHFHFPMASFGLYAVTATGGVGAPVALSPKNGFCIDDSYIENTTIEHSGEFIGSRSSCSDPSGLRGISVGGADEYDYRDPGQAIPIPGLKDGTYWFRAMTDPNNDFVEANEANNETDVKVTIAGSAVTAGSVVHPNTTPPTGTLTVPPDGGVVHGTTTLTATSTATGALKVDFLVDGKVVGSDTTSPYSMSWATTGVVDGAHWLAARVTDSLGRTGTTPVNQVYVNNVTPPPPPPGTTLTLDGRASKDGTGAQSAVLSGLHGGDLLLAAVGTDGSSTSSQTVSVTGSGLSWTLVTRSNGQAGSSEIWKAVLPSTATTVSVTSTPAQTGLDQSLTVSAFRGSAGIGASSAANAATGAPTTSLTTTRAGSFVVGAGNDWDGAVARTVGAGQALNHQWVDSTVGDTFWTQSVTAQVPTAGKTVAVNDTAPTNHRWNLVSAEVLAVNYTPPPPDVTPPTVHLTDPAAGSTVGGTVAVAATAADNVGVTSVTFTADGKAIGKSTTPPFMVSWNSTSVAAGKHTLAASAVDAAGNVGTSAGVVVTVDNSAPPPAKIVVEQTVSRQARGTLATPAFTTTHAGDVLVAFVAMDGSAPRTQTSTVTGGGLTWTLVKRANTQGGTSEIWAARSTGLLSNAVVTATPQETGFDGLLSVLALTGAAGTGVAGAGGGPNGAPSIYLPGVATGSWVFAVGNDWDNAVARTPHAGQVVRTQWVDTAAGDTFWVQSTAAPNTAMGLVTIADTAPTTDQWNYAAVEVTAHAG